MKRLILPVVLSLAGLAAGAALGLVLRPAPPEEAAADAEHGATAEKSGAAHDPAIPREYVRLNNQFIVPLVEGGRIAALVVLSLSLEIDEGSTEAVFKAEPKLRDAFLQVMFDHATAGGFRGAFTDAAAMEPLRAALGEAARQVMGSVVTDVLITEIVRQDS
jgi:flagellar basal body-associated protein FliL